MENTNLVNWGELYETLQEMKRKGDEIQDPLFLRAFTLFHNLEEAKNIKEIWALLDEANFSEIEINRINSPCLDGIYACRKYKKFCTFLAKHIDKFYESLVLLAVHASKHDVYGIVKILCNDQSDINLAAIWDWLFEIRCGDAFEDNYSKAVIRACERGSYYFCTIIEREQQKDIEKYIHHIFAKACRRGYLDIVELLFKYEPAKKTKYNKFTLERYLNMACQYGHCDIAKFLVEKGANVTNRSILSDAISSGNTKLVEFLIEKGALPDIVCLRDAVIFEYYDIVELLLKKVDNNMLQSCFVNAINTKNLDIIELFIKRGVEIEIPHIVPYIPIIDLFLKNGSSIHLHDDQFLHCAVKDGDTITAMALIDRGATPNKGLMAAALFNKVYFFPLFLERGANNYKQVLKVCNSRMQGEFKQWVKKIKGIDLN